VHPLEVGQPSTSEPAAAVFDTALAALGATVVDLPVDHRTRFQPSQEVLAPLLPLDRLVQASPSNPTGTMSGTTELRRPGAWCQAHGVRVVCDEIYHGSTYEQAALSALQFGATVVVVNSFPNISR